MPRVAGARRIVRNRKTLQCTFPECPKTFYAQAGLTQHILRKHQAPSAQHHTQAVPPITCASSGQADSEGENDDISRPEDNVQFMLFDDVGNLEVHGAAPGRSESMLSLIRIAECIF